MTSINSTSRRLAVVGGGMVAVSLLERLVALDAGWRITLFGDEPHLAYDRIALSKVLAGDHDPAQLELRPRAWYQEHGIELVTGCRVEAIDPRRRVLRSARGEEGFDACVLATGSEPLMPPIPGIDKAGVRSFRSLDDVRDLIEASVGGGHAVVIGGGLLGLEAARGLLARRMRVSVVHLMDRLMERQLDAGAGAVLRRELEGMGMEVHLPVQADRIEGNGRVDGVVLSSGTELPADLVVVCAGIRPNVRLAREADLAVGRGVVVDDGLATSEPGIYAVGECAEHRGVAYGLVAPLYEQAAVLARRLAGDGEAAFRPAVTATQLKVAGVGVFAGGRTTAETGDEEVLLRDDGRGVYKKLVLRERRVVGAALLGDLRPMPAVSDALLRQRDVDDHLALLGLGGEDERPPGADLPEDAIVCGCNGVSKREIVAAIQREGGCATRECVGACTRASTSCGSCGPVVEGLLRACGVDGARPAPAAKPVCACIPLPRAELAERVREAGLRTVSAVLARFGDGVGCHRCRPALSYYLDVWWCGAHQEEPASRHINDRVHANIQQDGTFSVVPRIRGGVTSPAELRRIADVAERYQVPAVKITGGQRIDLLGVRKQDLPSIWADLGLPSGFAYSKAVRTVKSCVGSEWCRFGVGDSTDLAVRLERLLEGLYTPHKMKLGVTGCPRNCAEVTVKDLGIVAVTGGWEIYVGGAAGMSVRKGDLLCVVPSAEQALEECAVALQHYREQAEYLERMYHFVPRIGIDAFRAATVDAPPEQRAALLDRFRRSKANARDPWQAVPERDPGRFAAAAV